MRFPATGGRGGATPIRVSIVRYIVISCLLAAASTAMAVTFKHKATGLVLPEKIAFFTRGDRIDLDSNYPGQGIGILYDLADIHAMVQIYDLGRKSREISEDEVKSQARAAHDDVLSKVERHYYDKADLLMEPSVYLKNGSGPVYATGFTVFVEGRSFREYFYVTYYRRHFVKIRVTHPGSANDDIVRNAFVRDFLKYLDESAKRDRYIF